MHQKMRHNPGVAKPVKYPKKGPKNMSVKPSYEALENRVAQLEARLDAHRNSEERFNKRKVESLFRSAPTGIGVVCDRVITQANLKLQEITGYSEQELLGQSSRMRYPTDGDYAYVGEEKYRQIDLHGTGTIRDPVAPQRR